MRHSNTAPNTLEDWNPQNNSGSDESQESLATWQTQVHAQEALLPYSFSRTYRMGNPLARSSNPPCLPEVEGRGIN